MFALSNWFRRRAAWKKFPGNCAYFFIMQGMVLALKMRLASLAPELEPPLDYRPKGYTAADALAVMGGYSHDARVTVALLEAADCLYCFGYAVLFASALNISFSVIDAPSAAHLLNLLPLAAAVVDVVENGLMLALLASPKAARLAAAVVPVSQCKWQLLMATASVVGGTGMFCVYKGLKMKRGGGGRRGKKGEAAAAGAGGGGDAAQVSSSSTRVARKPSRRA